MENPTTPNTPGPETIAVARAPRRWSVPLAFVGGAAALALAGFALVTSSGAASATEALMVRGEHAQHAEHGSDGALRMQARGEVDPAVRGQHIAELAQRLGVDADELTATLETFHADRAVDREAMQERLAGLEPAERRDAMRAFAAERRAALAGVLGVDVNVLAELHAELHDGDRNGPRGPQGGRMGPHARN